MRRVCRRGEIRGFRRSGSSEASAVVASIMRAKGGYEIVLLNKGRIEKETDLVARVESKDAGDAVGLSPDLRAVAIPG